MSTKNNNGFDQFFQNFINSSKWKSLTNLENNINFESLENTLKSMESDVNRASEMMKTFDNHFASQEIKNSLSESQKSKQTGNNNNENPKTSIEIQRFEKKEWKPFWFEAIAWMDSLKKELSESFIKPIKFKFLIQKLKNNNENTPNKNTKALEKLYEAYEKFKIDIPTGMLLYGPPWTGKTFITKKLAEELWAGFIAKNMWEFGSSYLHQTTKNIKDFFDAAKKASKNEPIILFLDEIDSLVSARTNNVDANKAEEVSQFLQEFNSLAEEAPNLIVIAASNRPDHLDSALLRSGRLDKKIYLWPPDENARKELFKMYIETSGRPHEKLDYDELAILTTWYVSADIKNIADEVARDASKNLLELIDEAENGNLEESLLNNHKITMEDLRKTILETPSSLKMVDMSIYENWLKKIS